MNQIKIFLSIVIISISTTINAQQTGEIKEVPPELTEYYQPVPKVVTPGEGTSAPSDAILLFNGKDLNNWKSEKGGQAKWLVNDGIMTVVPASGGIVTDQKFMDFQLHIEWQTPLIPQEKKGQNYGNSGIFLQERYEVQVLNNYINTTYVNGQAGSIYKQHPPLVNACKPPGEWQTYDIIFIAPRFSENGMLASPARATVLHNGILVQNYTEIKGPTTYRGLPKYEPHEAASLLLQEHGNSVSYRNIWVREL
jgi:hypothetical protein